MGNGVQMALRLEVAWVVMEVAAMAMFAACYTIQAKRLRITRTEQRVARPLAPVICIDRR